MNQKIELCLSLSQRLDEFVQHPKRFRDGKGTGEKLLGSFLVAVSAIFEGGATGHGLNNEFDGLEVHSEGIVDDMSELRSSVWDSTLQVMLRSKRQALNAGTINQLQMVAHCGIVPLASNTTNEEGVLSDDTQFLWLELRVDGAAITNFLYYAVDLNELLRSTESDGEFEILTCWCGVAECAGIEVGVAVGHDSTSVHWKIT